MKIDHIQLAMPEGQEEKARAFFAGVLGMSEEEKPYPLSERGGCWFRKESVILHVGVEKGFVPQKKAHLAFVVADLEKLERKLIDKGYQVAWDDTLAERKRFYTSDPFGNRMELLEEGDGFSQK